MIRFCTSAGSPIASGWSIHLRRSATVIAAPALACSRRKCERQCSSSTKWLSPVLPKCTGSAIERISCRSTRSPTGARPSALPIARSSSGHTFFTTAGLTSASKTGCAGYWCLKSWSSSASNADFRFAPTGGSGVSVWSSERNCSSGAIGFTTASRESPAMP
ncbi:MAG: hypothetical protein AW10_01316 [Candidatus Accumulibacter appositus]|uniref:Uncharacterized protein n=1 Tax=Candidatus Accumulibacter appositus TaxID=1454003 RepID=A0A011PW80_9PROT|nr:MAG: hypothetical protein AW10_01316 [Candidatus Accumulibacter appositus]